MSRSEPGNVQFSPASSRLFSLVDELLLTIINHLDNRQALCSLASTCTRFQDIVEPFIWRVLLVVNGTHARKVAIALDSRDVRVDYVQSISVRYKDENREGIEELNHFMGLMKKLRHFELESPCPNNSEWRSNVFFDGYSKINYTNLLASSVYPRLGFPLALPMLQSLTLHAHGPDDKKFVLGRAKCVFMHPTLRKITLSCLNFEADMDLNDNFIAERQKSTPLQSLTLIECNVDVKFLDAILSLPRALRELSIGERLHVFAECEPSMDRDKRTSSPLFLTALQRQAGSLQRLTHIGGVIQWIPARGTDHEGAVKLRSLNRLEHLELGFESHLYYYLRNNGFPPSLKTLKMLDAAISLNTGRDIQGMSDIAFRSITSLVTDCLYSNIKPGFVIQLHFADHSAFRLFVIAHPAEQNRLLSTQFLDRPAIYNIATILKSYNAHFHISRETFPLGTAYIPPYMYGEALPVEEIMYNSNDYWRFNGIDYQVMDDDQLRAELRRKSKLKYCLRCKTRNKVNECRSLGNGSACVPCASVLTECRWAIEDERETD
ncbi:hypothetical protein GQ44DRAFT_728646 [Phaeosphaeriaceae sp. PMI808]|nr:hypothetical protein GQ44DRAFT_728646 [Phaeosphaeriaceae sp. PMI808]